MRHNKQSRSPLRHGFTLVELMMVIAIIGILVGMTVVGINAGARSIKRRAIALEVASLTQAVEAYKLKYGEYPPDGSNRAAFEAHFKGVFPNIDINPQTGEFARLYSVANSNFRDGGVMDPAESVVFCLGGYSNDPTRPFTGTGGPLTVDATTNQLIYNPDRNKGFFDFDEGRLVFDDEVSLGTLYNEGAPNGNPIGENDALPVYVPRGGKAPYVYFSASTYSFPIAGTNSHYYNHYKAAEIGGIARPYKSETQNRSVQMPTHSSTAVQAERFYRYMNDKSFQIISAGLDNDYGGDWDAQSRGLIYTNDSPAFFTFPSGAKLNIFSGPISDSGYINQSGGPSAQLDNVTNFSEGTLEATLP